MKYVKVLAIAVAAMAMMAFAAGSASATALYNFETKLEVNDTIDFKLLSEKRAELVDTEGGLLDECASSTVKGSITNAGGVGTAVQGSISELTWGSCTFTTKTTVNGGLEVTQIGTSTEGTVKSNAEIGVTINTVLFGSCVYGVEKGTDLGKLTTFKEVAAQFDANAVAKKLSGSNFACPATAKWTATYVSSTPVKLRVEEK